jgi:nucleolar protein 16
MIIFCIADVKSALGKKWADGKSAPLQPLTTMQRFHIKALVDKYGDDYPVRH